MPARVYGAADIKKKRVYYSGTSTLKTGQPLCYNMDEGTAADVDWDRHFEVENPTTSNNLFFAGVVHESSDAIVGPAYITIVEPGSMYYCYTDQNCTINATAITAKAGASTPLFYTQGFRGRGTAIAMQTVDRSSTAGTVLALLDDGVESGLVESVTPANGAMTIMTGGITYFPATTIGTGDATYTLADGTIMGQQKGFICEGTMATNDIVVTVTTVQIIAAVAVTGYDVCTMDAAGEHLVAEWNGKAWEVQGSVLA